MLESLGKNKVFVKVTFESPSKMLHVSRNIHFLHFLSMFWKTFAFIYQASHVIHFHVLKSENVIRLTKYQHFQLLNDVRYPKP